MSGMKTPSFPRRFFLTFKHGVLGLGGGWEVAEDGKSGERERERKKGGLQYEDEDAIVKLMMLP